MLGSHLLPQLPARGRERLLGAIDPALRHLPGVEQPAAALADEQQAGAIDQRQAPPRPIPGLRSGAMRDRLGERVAGSPSAPNQSPAASAPAPGTPC